MPESARVTPALSTFALACLLLACTPGGAANTDTDPTSGVILTDTLDTGGTTTTTGGPEPTTTASGTSTTGAPTTGAGTDTSGTDTGEPSECPTYQELCDGACVPTSVDPANCGGCGVTCSQDQVCWGSGCADACPSGLMPCAGTCVDIKTDGQHCNACDFACEAGTGCVDGNCQPLIDVGPEPASCAGGGPPISLDFPSEQPDEGEVCAGDVAETAFTWAICSCNDIELFNPLLTDAYDSDEGPYVPYGLGGGVGLNGDFLSTSVMDVYGSLWSSNSTAGMSTSNEANIFQELHVGGPLTAGNPFLVGMDAFVTGDIETSSTMEIAGTLHHPVGAQIVGDVTYGALVNEPVEVPDPCKCEPDEILPIAEIVAQHADDNDNALIGLDPGALIDPGVPTRLQLACGRYYLTGIDTNAPLVIATSGRTALFVDGDIITSSPLAFVVEPGGELDVLVAGGLNTSAKMTFGSPSYPALARLYLGGVGQSLILTNDVLIGGFVYLARGELDVSNPLEIYGGVIAGEFRNSGMTAVHYDKHVLEVGEDCPDDTGGDGGCESCADCGNQACVDGECGSCTDSSQCCAPLVCWEGACVPVVP